MGDTKSKHKYRNFNVPRILAEKIEEVLASGNHGHTSVPDFVEEATRRYLRELGYI